MAVSILRGLPGCANALRLPGQQGQRTRHGHSKDRNLQTGDGTPAALIIRARRRRLPEALFAAVRMRMPLAVAIAALSVNICARAAPEPTLGDVEEPSNRGEPAAADDDRPMPDALRRQITAAYEAEIARSDSIAMAEWQATKVAAGEGSDRSPGRSGTLELGTEWAIQTYAACESGCYFCTASTRDCDRTVRFEAMEQINSCIKARTGAQAGATLEQRSSALERSLLLCVQERQAKRTPDYVAHVVTEPTQSATVVAILVTALVAIVASAVLCYFRGLAKGHEASLQQGKRLPHFAAPASEHGTGGTRHDSKRGDGPADRQLEMRRVGGGARKLPPSPTRATRRNPLSSKQQPPDVAGFKTPH